MTKLLITGVAGFIGAHTLEHFLENTDWEIIGMDSLAHKGNMGRITQVLRKNPQWVDRFTFKQIDLADYRAVSELYQPFADQIDYIINLAAESHVDRSISEPVPFIRNNFDLMVNMLEWARQIPNLKAFIQISTDEVYGPMDNQPFKEWDRELPSNPYSASKACQEMLAISYWRTYGVPIIITNTMNNIGEMQDVEKFVPMLIRDISEGKKAQIHGTSEYIGSRYYLHARNHADALLFILQNVDPKLYPEAGEPERFHIVGDTRLSNLQMAERIAANLGMLPLSYELIDFHSTRPGHDLDYGLDGSKIKALGWNPPLLFEDSLERTIKNYIENKEWLGL